MPCLHPLAPWNPGRRGHRLTRAASVIGLAAMLASCSPTLDWRYVQPEGWSLQAQLPCRPDVHERTLALAGQPVQFTMQVCAANGHTVALGSARVADPQAVGPALQALAAAARLNIAAKVVNERPAAVPGMTPQPAAVRQRLLGQRPGGEAVHEELLVFAHGLRVFQATVVGPVAGSDVVQPFVEALRITP